MTDFETLNRIATERYSCRAYKPDPVPRETIQNIVQVAQKVPTWCNAQPWKLTITEGAGTQRFGAALYDQAMSNAPDPDIEWPKAYPGTLGERRRACGFQLYDALQIPKDDRAGRAAQMMENFRFFGAPHVAIVTTPAVLGTYGAVDCGGFVAVFTQAATAQGLGTIAQGAIAAQAPFVRDFFELPEDEWVLCAISFGYPDTNHPANAFRTDRAAVGDVVTWHDT